jgi:hypothetical protein
VAVRARLPNSSDGLSKLGRVANPPHVLRARHV